MLCTGVSCVCSVLIFCSCFELNFYLVWYALRTVLATWMIRSHELLQPPTVPSFLPVFFLSTSSSLPFPGICTYCVVWEQWPSKDMIFVVLFRLYFLMGTLGRLHCRRSGASLVGVVSVSHLAEFCCKAACVLLKKKKKKGGGGWGEGPCFALRKSVTVSAYVLLKMWQPVWSLVFISGAKLPIQLHLPLPPLPDPDF